MNLIGKKGTLGVRGHTVLCVLIGLLAYAASSQAADSPEEEVSSLKLRLDLLKKHYRKLCQIYSNLPSNCSAPAPALNCTECPDGWLQVDDQCFHLSTDRHNFETSSKKCEKQGAHLAILTNKDQHDAVEKEGRRLGSFYNHYWIGLTDIDHEGEWKWVDNSALKVPHWDVLKSEPDNNPSGGPEGQDCVVVDSYERHWHDVPCSFTYPRICQKDAIPLV